MKKKNPDPLKEADVVRLEESARPYGRTGKAASGRFSMSPPLNPDMHMSPPYDPGPTALRRRRER
jgi:hypothetical protein